LPVVFSRDLDRRGGRPERLGHGVLELRGATGLQVEPAPCGVGQEGRIGDHGVERRPYRRDPLARPASIASWFRSRACPEMTAGRLLARRRD